jgi:hypothetical protein
MHIHSFAMTFAQCGVANRCINRKFAVKFKIKDMIDFKPIILEDKERVDAILSMNTYSSSDLTFTNLFAWSPMYHTRMAIVEQTLFVCYDDSKERTNYMMPIGALPVREALELMMRDAEERGICFQMSAITPRMWADIEAAMPERFTLIPDRDNYEYVYTSEKLIRLAGSKLQSKRNHINRFKADNPDWTYSPIASEEDISDCIRVLNEWEDAAAPEGLLSYRFDYAATCTMLEHFRYLKLRGGIIRTGGRAVAFTLGEPLSDEVMVVHVEKAFAEINGAYTIINQQFVEHEAAGYRYVNREEDVGLENLRKAKMSYHPDILLEHGIVKPIR